MNWLIAAVLALLASLATAFEAGAQQQAAPAVLQALPAAPAAQAQAGAQALYARLAAKPHPRSMPAAGEVHGSELTNRVDRRLNGFLLPEDWATEEARRTIAALRAYAATRQQAYFEESLRRASHLASWDPRGATGHLQSPEDSRSIAWALALAYDWLSPRLEARQKNLILASLRTRAADLHRDSPLDSGPTLAAIATLVAGDVPEALDWIQGAAAPAVASNR